MCKWSIIFNQYQPNEKRYIIIASSCDEAITKAMKQEGISKRPSNISAKVVEG